MLLNSPPSACPARKAPRDQFLHYVLLCLKRRRVWAWEESSSTTQKRPSGLIAISKNSSFQVVCHSMV